MTKYDQKTLQKVLVKHGYKVVRMTPEWAEFALAILVNEKLDKLLKK